MSQTTLTDNDQIKEVINKYVQGVISGNVEIMKPAFHQEATMYGFLPTGLVGGSIQNLFDFINEVGAAPNLIYKIDVLDVDGTIASARLKLEKDANGDSYTDLFQLLKIDGEWIVMAKLFHQQS